MGGRGHLRVRPHGHARAGVLGRHPAADGVGLAARRARVQLHPHRHRRPLPAHARQARLLPDGLGRQRPAHRAPRPELLRRAVRAEPAVRPGLHRARRSPASSRSRSRARTSSSSARRSPPRTRRRSRSCGAATACRSTGRTATRPSTPGPARSASARSCATSSAARPTCRWRRRCGTSRSAPPWRRPSSRTASTPARGTGSRTTATARRDVFIETTRPELIPACVALIAHPDDERYQPLFGTTVRSPLFDVEVPVLAHPAAEMDRGAGIAMCCTFGDLTDVQWWRELDLPNRTVINRDGRLLRETPEWITSPEGRQRYEELAGATVHTAKERIVAHAHRDRRARRRRPSRHAPGEVLREGRQAARDRLQPPVVHPQRRPGRGRARRDDRPRPGAAVAPGLHAPPLRGLGARPQRRLAGQPPALLRGAGAGLVPARRRRRGPARRGAHARRTTPCPSTPRPTSRPASPPTSATSRAASPATATSSTRGRRRR